MEKDLESWFRNQQTDWRSTNPISSSAPFGLQHRPNVPSLGNMFSPYMTNGNFPDLAFAESLPEEPYGWFYDLPPYRQGFTPAVDSIPKEPSVPGSTHGVQKKFLVFDQSNDRTTLIYSSNPFQYHLPKPQPTFDLKRENSVIERPEDVHCSNSFHEDGDNAGSEMREDTEELNALLYSDDDEIDYSEDEEEQSTGHSPGTMTGFDRHEWPDDNAEEVASSAGPRKRHKLDNAGYDVLSLEDTASSGKSGVNCSRQAEVSSCGHIIGARNRVPDVESETSPSGKRSRREKLTETISILQNLIPGGKNGKDAMMILDEAINYLRILKVKAKALGLDSL